MRRLGKGAVEINVTEEQVDDRVNDALLWWWDYHFEGSEKEYYKYQLTADDFTNKYITIPDNIIGAVRIFNMTDAYNSANMFSIRYQIALNDLYTLTSYSMVPYYMARMHLDLLEQILVGTVPIRFNRHQNRVYLDMDWSRYDVGMYVIVEGYKIVDPDTFTDAWSDRWLTAYATALIKRQWGTNLKKYTGMVMPGGVTFSGQAIYDEAVQEIAEIEREVIHSYSIPVSDMIG